MDRSRTKPLTTMGKFQNLDIRVARVIEVSEPFEIIDKTSVSRLYRVLRLDFAELGVKTSVGQFALVGREELLDQLVLAVCNLPPRRMGNSGEFISEVLTLGTHHPKSPPEQLQAVPIYAHDLASVNDEVY